ncbi:MAG TPA: hypothetical protein VMH33_01675 [Solirubrobacterales bacterium]|nr:hypothetical protein [Solirubrobacterales bacterium]
MSYDSNATAPDLFGLTQASIQTLIEDLRRTETLDDKGGAAPPRSEQVAALVVAEAIRLIRLGTKAEIARAARELSKLLIGSVGERLEEEQEEAHRLLSGASVALSAATPASSKGAARTVLRSWSGDAGRVMKLVLEAPGERAPRIQLRETMGIDDQSHFSHILSDLEAARLIIRVRTGKEKLVRVGPVGRTEEIREALGLVGGGPIVHRSRLDRKDERRNLVDFTHRHRPGVEPAEIAPPPPQEIFAVVENTSTFTQCGIARVNRLDPDAEDAFEDTLAATRPLAIS